ncbi:internalin [Bifidobacterium pseudolongum subsp. globosum]|uniref:Internalin n=1 Tax=Bifidobacterium pseudolongum subsp. globosum TaxID=1690 RepID=A0A8B3RNM5_9BIFI|nr:internalin [Bifidobacterium pseudolongum subsp. globosum]
MSPVVRQDMAAFLKRLAARAGRDGGVKPKTDFTDVTAATPHMADVQWLGGSGISQGYRNNDGSWRFEGMTRVYRQDMAAFIHRLDTHLTK